MAHVFLEKLKFLLFFLSLVIYYQCIDLVICKYISSIYTHTLLARKQSKKDPTRKELVDSISLHYLYFFHDGLLCNVHGEVVC
jgi:hypothetical protein